MRPFRLTAHALGIALCATLALPAAAQAGRVVTLGIYLWQSEDGGPAQAQYLSIAEGKTETEVTGPEGYKTDTHDSTPEEVKLVETAIEGRMKALSMSDQPKLPTPYVTVEWHFSQDSGYAEGIAAYPLKDVPESIRAVQKQVFGAEYPAEK